MSQDGAKFGDALTGAFHGAVGEAASAEDQFHIKAGLAQMFQPCMHTSGLKRMLGGLALVAFSSKFGGSGTGGATSADSGGADMGGAGTQVPTEEETKRRGVVEVVDRGSSELALGHELARIMREYGTDYDFRVIGASA